MTRAGSGCYTSPLECDAQNRFDCAETFGLVQPLQGRIKSLQPGERRADRSPAAGRIGMNKLLRALIAGYGAQKLGGGCMGGGCLGTIVVFVLIYWLLGSCDHSR